MSAESRSTHLPPTILSGIILLLLAIPAGCDQQSGSTRATTDRAATPINVPEPGARFEPPLIVVDGHFDDWADVNPLLIDPADAPGEPIDIGAIRVTHDERYVHIKLAVGNIVNLQRIPESASLDLIIDVDGDAATGRTIGQIPGADAVITFTARRDRGGPMGVSLLATVPVNELDIQPPLLNPYDVGLTFAPTYASDRFEIRIERGVAPSGMPEWFTGDSFTARFIARHADGRVFDETDVFEYALLPVTKQSDSGATIPPRQADAIRIANWNVRRGELFNSPELFAAVVRAIDADVYLLQELHNTQTAEMLESWLNEHLPATASHGEWQVIWGAGGGDLRCAIAARQPLRSVPELHMVPYPDRPDRQVRIAAAEVEFQDHSILLVTTHLKCCGFAGSSEDLSRIEEVELIKAAVATVFERGGIHGYVVGGDLNLVGSRDPLDILVTSTDLDGSNLRTAELLQLGGRSNSTWHDPDQPFVAGRLDYIIYSDSSLLKQQGFVLDSRHLSESERERHGLTADAVLLASDHFPLVIDLTPRGLAGTDNDR